MGGFDDELATNWLSSVEQLDPQRLLPGWQSVADMLNQRSNFAIASIEDKIQVMGGLSPGGGFGECEIYDPEANTWTPCAPLAEGRHGMAAITISNLPAGHSIPI